jgi:hypothetical protein
MYLIYLMVPVPHTTPYLSLDILLHPLLHIRNEAPLPGRGLPCTYHHTSNALSSNIGVPLCFSDIGGLLFRVTVVDLLAAPVDAKSEQAVMFLEGCHLQPGQDLEVKSGMLVTWG